MCAKTIDLLKKRAVAPPQAADVLNKLPAPSTPTQPRSEFCVGLTLHLADLDCEDLRTLCGFFNCDIGTVTTRVMDYLYGQARQEAALERKKARQAKKAKEGASQQAKAHKPAPPAPTGPLEPGIRCALCTRAFALCLSVSNLRKGGCVCPVAKMREAVRAKVQARGIALAQAYLCWDCYNDVLEGDYPS